MRPLQCLALVVYLYIMKKLLLIGYGKLSNFYLWYVTTILNVFTVYLPVYAGVVRSKGGNVSLSSWGSVACIRSPNPAHFCPFFYLYFLNSIQVIQNQFPEKIGGEDRSDSDSGGQVQAWSWLDHTHSVHRPKGQKVHSTRGAHYFVW